MAKLERKAPRIAQHDEHGAIGRENVLHVGCTCGDETGGVGRRIGAQEGYMQHQVVHGGVVGHRGGGITVNFEDGGSVVAKEMSLVRVWQVTQHSQAEVLGVPSGKGEGIGDVEGEVLDGHARGEEKGGLAKTGIGSENLQRGRRFEVKQSTAGNQT